MGTVSEVLGASAKVKGTVNPGDEGTYWSFEYSTDGVAWSGFGYMGYIEGADPELKEKTQNVEATIGGLKASTKYFVRLTTLNVAQDKFVFSPASAPYPEFTTLAVAAPSIESVDNASSIEYTTAKLSGKVKRPAGATGPEAGVDVNCVFEYVSDAQFKATGFEQLAGAVGCGPVNPLTVEGTNEVNGEIGGLQPNTTYHFRLTASNAGGSQTQEAPSFITKAVTPPTVSGIETAELGNISVLAKGNVSRVGNADPAFNTYCGFEYITDAKFQKVGEKQKLVVKASGGTFTLTFEGKTTAPLAYNSAPGAVQVALEGLSTVGAGNIIVTGGPGSATGSQPYTISFVGALGALNVGDIGTDGSALTSQPGQGVPRMAVETLVQGHAEGFEGGEFRDCTPNGFEVGGSFPVSAKLPDLRANTVYHLRLRASNQGGEDTEDTTFKTTAVIQAQSLTPSVEAQSASLNGRINPFNAPVTYQFEWGLVEGEGDETYEKAIPLSPQPLGVEVQTFKVVSAALSGLLPNTAYHYRLKATNTQSSQVALGADRTFTTGSVRPTPPGENCSNASSRFGPSASLPDCRAWEFISPGLNGAGFFNWPSPTGGASADGKTAVFQTKDAPLSAEGGSAQNMILARRGPNGWHLIAGASPIPSPVAGFLVVYGAPFAEDLEHWFSFSSVPPTPENELDSPELDGHNGYLYLHEPNGKWVTIGKHPNPGMYWPTAQSSDASHVIIRTISPQLPGDPESTLYDWTKTSLKRLAVLPGSGEELLNPAVIAGSLGALGGLSSDGEAVLFNSPDASGLPGTEPHLYLRLHGEETIEVNKTQRTPAEALPEVFVRSEGISQDGSTVFFTSSSELTNDANTGTVGPQPGRTSGDLYSYDVATGKLTDLTVDNKAIDAATGADVVGTTGASLNASYIYLVAKGQLAPGGVSGQANVYVLHNGKFDFVAPADGMGDLYATPDGRHAAFTSVENLTGYNNPKGFAMAYEYTYGGGIECGSCRPDGEPPTANAEFAYGFGAMAGTREGNRYITDDGSRMFFQSSDQIVPEAKNGLSNIYEYTNGKAYMLTPGDSPAPIRLLDVSASGDDVFVATMEELTPGEGEGESSSVYDARVGGTRPAPQPTPCTGENCRGARTSAPQSSTPATVGFEAPGKVIAPKSVNVKSSKLQLRISVPGAGKVSFSGSGLKPGSATAKKAGMVAVMLTLKPGAKKALARKGVFKTTVNLSFTPTAGDVSRASISVKFETGKKKKGGK
ncbi:MAG TPA: hypothetical protein VGO36_06580 [Solirubrobacterales bacterium]|jgi:hypothetical protein|nr:hypothetical protein [Solirubrobacterales bacterium]